MNITRTVKLVYIHTEDIITASNVSSWKKSQRNFNYTSSHLSLLKKIREVSNVMKICEVSKKITIFLTSFASELTIHPNRNTRLSCCGAVAEIKPFQKWNVITLTSRKQIAYIWWHAYKKVAVKRVPTLQTRLGPTILIPLFLVGHTGNY